MEEPQPATKYPAACDDQCAKITLNKIPSHDFKCQDFSDVQKEFEFCYATFCLGVSAKLQETTFLVLRLRTTNVKSFPSPVYDFLRNDYEEKHGGGERYYY